MDSMWTPALVLVGVNQESLNNLPLMESIRSLDEVHLEPRRILQGHIVAVTLREVHQESTWTPGKISVDSMDCPWSLFGLLMESTRMRGSV